MLVLLTINLFGRSRLVIMMGESTTTTILVRGKKTDPPHMVIGIKEKFFNIWLGTFFDWGTCNRSGQIDIAVVGTQEGEWLLADLYLITLN